MMIVTEHIRENFTKLINPDGVLGLITVGLISNQLFQGWGIPWQRSLLSWMFFLQTSIVCA